MKMENRTVSKERAVSTIEGLVTFRVPRVIFTSGNMKTLSANAFKLFLAVAYDGFKQRATEIVMTMGAIYSNTGLDLEAAEAAATELTEANVMDFVLQGRTFTFQTLQPDQSKARSYMSLDGKVDKQSKQD
jgi:hypothetical protein